MSASLIANEVFITHLVNGQSITVTTGSDSEARVERSLREKEVHHQRIGATSSSTIGNNLPDMDITVRCVRGTVTVSDPIAPSAGDVIAAGNNTFTGNNVFDGTATEFGPNLITNGDFATDATGWDLHDCATWSAGKVTMTYTGVEDWATVTTDAISFEVGETYRIRFTISGLANDAVYIYTDTTFGTEPTIHTDGTYDFIFTATIPSETLSIEAWNWAAGATFSVDNVSVCKALNGGATLEYKDRAGNNIVPGAVSTGLNYGIGPGVFASITSASSQNTAFGSSALGALTAGYNNSAFGRLTLGFNTTGQDNSAFGAQTLSANTTGSHNSAFGSGAILYNTTGSGNTGIGESALCFSTTGGSNTAVGSAALRLNTTGGENTAVGVNALRDATTANYNTAVGASSMINAVGDGNVAVGDQAAFNLSAGAAYNTFLGFQSGLDAAQKTDATYSVAIGWRAYTTKNGQVVIGGTNTVETVVRGLRNMVGASETPDVNGQMVFELTSDTSLKVKVKGSDGTVRSVTLTLS